MKITRKQKQEINRLMNGEITKVVTFKCADGFYGSYLELSNGDRVSFSVDSTLTYGFRFYGLHSIDWQETEDVNVEDDIDKRQLKQALVNWCLQIKKRNIGKGSAFTKRRIHAKDLDEKVIEFNPDDFEDAHE